MAISGGGAPRLFPDYDPSGQYRFKDSLGSFLGSTATRFLGFNQAPVFNNPGGWSAGPAPGPAPGGPGWEGTAVRPTLLELILSKGNEPNIGGIPNFARIPDRRPIVNRVGSSIGLMHPLHQGMPAKVGTDINLRDMRKLLAALNMKQMQSRLGRAAQY